jgi:hypothetical protein
MAESVLWRDAKIAKKIPKRMIERVLTSKQASALLKRLG